MALIPITDVLSKDKNSFKVQTNGIYDHRGYNGHVSVFGDQLMARRTDDVSVKFHYNNSPYEVIEVVTGTGVVTNTSSKAKVETGAGIGKAEVYSKETVRYRPGHEAFSIFTAVYSTGEANVTQRVGCFDSEDGFYVGYEEANFGFSIRTGGVNTFIPQSSWNGDQFLTGDFVLNPQMMNIYRISYGWLGIAPITLEVSADNGENWTVAHQIDERNSQTNPSIMSPMLPIRMEVEATSAPTGSKYIECSSWNGGTIGGESTDASSVDRYFSIDAGTKSIAAATPTNILTVRNPATYKGKTNNVKSQLLFVSVTADGNKPVKITTYKNATVGGTPSFSDVSTDSSTLQFDTAGTTVSGGTASFPFTVGINEGKDLYVKDFGLFLAPGDDVTFTAESTQVNDVTFTMRERSFF